MARKEAYATSNIKTLEGIIPVGEKIDPNKFTKEQFKALYDNGAVELRDVPEPKKEAGPSTTVEVGTAKPVKASTEGAKTGSGK